MELVRGVRRPWYMLKETGPFFDNREDFTLGDIEAHLPFICPRSKHLHILCQYFMIILTPDRMVKQRIVSKESDGRVEIVVYIINVEQK